MAYRPFTPEWADAFCRVINADAEYHETARGWTWPIAFILDRDPALGYRDDTAVVLKLDRGVCHGVKLVTRREVSAPFVFAAPYAVWKQLVRGELDPMVGVMQRRLRLEHGALTTLMMHTRSAKALVACAGKVDTEFPDEAGGERAVQDEARP